MIDGKERRLTVRIINDGGCCRTIIDGEGRRKTVRDGGNGKDGSVTMMDYR